MGRAGRCGGATGLLTGFAFGDGGMASPKRGPALAGREPGMAGRSIGGAAGMVGTWEGGLCCGIPRAGWDGCVAFEEHVSNGFRLDRMLWPFSFPRTIMGVE